MVGYIVLITIIGSMATILLHERRRVFRIESEMKRIDSVQRDVNTAHRYITLLAMRGETALAWEEEDFEDFRSFRLRVDSMMLAMQGGSEEFVSRAQIDTLRYLLANKEEHLRQIMLLFREQDSPDGLQLTRLPKEVRSKTIIRKKERYRRTVRCKGNSGNSLFRICNTPHSEQGTAIHAGRTAGNHRHLC